MILLFLLFYFPTQIGSCSVPNATIIEVYIEDEIYNAPSAFHPLIIKTFYQTEGEQNKWLGYAPRNLPNWRELEIYGEDNGYGYGINLPDLSPHSTIILRDQGWNSVARYTISNYGEKYFVTQTSLNQYARSDGTAYDFHILPNPLSGSCMWLIDKENLSWLDHIIRNK